MGAEIGSPTRRAMIKTGTYTGDGTDNRNIDIGVNLASKQNAYVIIKGLEAQHGLHRIEYGQGDLTMHFVNNSDDIDDIQQFNSSGFQIGSGNAVNTNENIYRYIVFWEEP